MYGVALTMSMFPGTKGPDGRAGISVQAKNFVVGGGACTDVTGGDDDGVKRRGVARAAEGLDLHGWSSLEPAPCASGQNGGLPQQGASVRSKGIDRAVTRRHISDGANILASGMRSIRSGDQGRARLNRSAGDAGSATRLINALAVVRGHGVHGVVISAGQNDIPGIQGRRRERGRAGLVAPILVGAATGHGGDVLC